MAKIGLYAKFVCAVRTFFRRVFIASLALALAACGQGGTKATPVQADLDSAKRAIEQTMALLERAIDSEDTVLAGNEVADIFKMDGIVAFRFRRSSAPAQPAPQQDLARLLDDFFRDNQNIVCTLRPTDVTRNGDIAWADVEFHLEATYAVESPPINYFVDALDRVTFEREQGAWKLIDWEEVEEVQSGNQENPGNIEPIVAVNRTIQDLAKLVNTQDFRNQSRIISSIFNMNPDVGKRFKTATTVSGGNPASNFQAFFSEVFSQNENIVFSLNVSAYDIQNDVATVTAEFSLVSTFILAIPPEVYDSAATDDINLRKESDGYWRIISWVEAPSTAPEPLPEDLCKLSVLSLQEALRGEDLSLLGNSLAPEFYLDGGIANRFMTHVTAAGQQPSANIASFTNDFFAENVNIDFQLVLSDFTQNGEVANATVGFNLNSTYVLTVPPTTYSVVVGDDRMQFQKNADGVWQVLRWLPAEALPPAESALIDSLLTSIGSSITDRDTPAAASALSSLFSLDAGLALRFTTHHTIDDPPSSDFATHMNLFLSENANVAVTIAPDLATLDINAELAHIEADQVVTGDYLVTDPVTHYENTDRVVFDLVKTSGAWLVYRWTLKP